MKFQFFTITTFIMLSIIACKNDHKIDSTQNTNDPTENIVKETFTYISTDGYHKFEFQNTENGCTLHDITNHVSYIMDHMPSGSGAKYESKDGYVFWTKGDEFTFFKNDDIITQGTLSDHDDNNTLKHIGNYVSEGYEKRHEGYDWVAVTVREAGINKLGIAVRSRADKKKPTCTFNTIASKIDENTYKAFENNTAIIFNFNNDQISINTENKEDDHALFFYCSGGGSLQGNYQRITDDLDKSQIDKSLYSKVLNWNEIGFNISLVEKESANQLTIVPYGLTITNEPETHTIEGIITNAEIEDLNADGFPEILIYIQSTKGNQFGSVIGYSVNDGKSISQIHLPNITDNEALNKGYMGHDEFAIVETTLVQRFPIHKEKAVDTTTTKNMRQIQYKLKDSEASRIFVVDKIVEY